MVQVGKCKDVRGNTFFAHDDVDSAKSLNPFTHIYMFDIGFPYNLLISIAKKFNCSLYATCLISYQTPSKIINTFGFEVIYIGQLLTSMLGKCI
jgi:hypothetical protein